MAFHWRSLAGIALVASALTLSACSDDDPTGPIDLPPTNATVVATSATSATVSWAAVTDATNYIVQRAPGASGGTFATISPATLTATTLLDTGLEPNAPYRYRVQAIRPTGPSQYTAEISVTTNAAGTVAGVISANITANRILYADTVYTLLGFIQVTNGATLTIQPGTKIRGDTALANIGSSLFITRGAKIDAQGTAANPIVFTSARSAGNRKPGDWGGVIIIGNGIINRTGSIQVEGTGVGANNPAQIYSGGTSNTDNSGIMRYVRIEFAGYATAPNQELNSLTLAAVGSGTVVEYIQTMAGLDDSYEWFGGAVDGKYLVSYESGDDHFDLSEGFVGRLQYLIAMQTRIIAPLANAGSPAVDPQGIENDGCDSNAAGCANQLATPLTTPIVANFTLYGTGTTNGVTLPAAGGRGMMLRRGTGGYYVNGIVSRFPAFAISFRDTTTFQRATAGDFVLSNILFAENGALFEPQATPILANTVRHYTADTTVNKLSTVAGTASALFTSVAATLPANGATFDWAPVAAGAAATGGLATFTGALQTKAGTFIAGTAFRGAADPAGPKWWQGWTSYTIN
ncbi:MAG: fibronectin type III domain-containing protein [Gemmatimonadaceae bacterium]|nr:fibronectin type III domain-containing protein [Gemmatimonadaceae bacterium]